MAPSQTSTSGNRMTHSISTPSGVDGSASTMGRGSKKLAIRVQMLDDSITLFQVQVNFQFIFYLVFFLLLDDARICSFHFIKHICHMHPIHCEFDAIENIYRNGIRCKDGAILLIFLFCLVYFIRPKH